MPNVQVDIHFRSSVPASLPPVAVFEADAKSVCWPGGRMLLFKTPAGVELAYNTEAILRVVITPKEG